jgi:integrase
MSNPAVQVFRKDPLGGDPLRLCHRPGKGENRAEVKRRFLAQAEAWVSERRLIKEARARGLEIADPSTPSKLLDFPSYFERHYLPWFREHRGERTLRSRASAFMVLVEDLAGVSLDKAEHQADDLVERWRKEGVRYRASADKLGRELNRPPRPITDAGINERLRRLREVLMHAYKRTRVLQHPPRLSLLTIKGSVLGAEKPIRFFLPEERVRFKRYAPPDVADAFDLMCLLGFRPAEFVHGRVDWVDLKRGKVVVQACPCPLCPDGRWVPKTGRFRAIDICADVKPILKRLMKGKADDALLVPTTHGAPISRLEGSGGRFVKTLVRAGLDRAGLSMYSARHTFAADLITAGKSIKEVSVLLGNSPRVCEAHYGHLLPGKTAEAVQVLRAVRPWPEGSGSPSATRSGKRAA